MGSSRAWLTNSLGHRAREMRSWASRARKAYTKEPMASMAQELASAYDEAAAVFERALTAPPPERPSKEEP